MKAIGIQFPWQIKAFDFDPGKIEIALGALVVVETEDNGPQIGRVVYLNKEVKESLSPVIRKATDEDLKKQKENQVKAKEYLDTFDRKIKKFGLLMRSLLVQLSLDGEKIIFFFGAEERVDFRELVKDLNQTLGKSARLVQVGERDAAKILGGIGPCGQPICCQRFLMDFQSITKEFIDSRDYSRSSAKISGLCGKLMCCLAFEAGLSKSGEIGLNKLERKVFLKTKNSKLQSSVALAKEDESENKTKDLAQKEKK